MWILIPYPGAAYLAVRFTGAQNLYDSNNYYNFYQEPSQYERYAADIGFTWDIPYFKAIVYDNGQKTLYKSANDDNSNLGGRLPILFWYASQDSSEPLYVEYFAAIEDSVTLRYSSTVVDYVSNIPVGDTDKPILIDSQGNYIDPSPESDRQPHRR